MFRILNSNIGFDQKLTIRPVKKSFNNVTREIFKVIERLL